MELGEFPIDGMEKPSELCHYLSKKISKFNGVGWDKAAGSLFFKVRGRGD